jgi:hypothetical protein
MAAYVVFKACEYRLSHELAGHEPPGDDGSDAQPAHEHPKQD